MSSVEQLIQDAQDANIFTYYWIALATLLCYDYFLTLADEVRYAWKGKKSYAFAIFILNRYLPMLFMIWAIISNFSWTYISNKLVVDTFFLIWCTLIAQIILNMRIYAITMRNRVITGFFSCITVSQLVLGVCGTAWVAGVADDARAPPIFPTPKYDACSNNGNRGVEIAYATITLGYDTLAFLVIVFFAMSGRVKGFNMPRLLRTIVQDSTIYFLVIFTSHFVLEMSLLFLSPNMQLLPALGTYVYLPVMIGRLMLSLRKAADASEAGWSLTSVSRTPSGRKHRAPRRLGEMVFAPVLDEGTVMSTEGDIPLAAASSSERIPV